MTKLIKQKAIIVDLDWCCCYEPFIGDVPQNSNREEWDKFHEDRYFYSPKSYRPIREIIDLIEGYYNSSYIKPMIIFLTSREDTAQGLIRLNSYRFIRKNFKCFHRPQDYNRSYLLLMRKEDDYRPSAEIKEEYLHEILKNYNVIMAFDDDKNNVNMFVENGVTTLQVYSKDVYDLLNNK